MESLKAQNNNLTGVVAVKEKQNVEIREDEAQGHGHVVQEI